MEQKRLTAYTDKFPQQIKDLEGFLDGLKWVLHRVPFDGIIRIDLSGKGIEGVNFIELYVNRSKHGMSYKTVIHVIEAGKEKEIEYKPLTLVKAG